LEINLTEKKSNTIAITKNKSPFSEILTGASMTVVVNKMNRLIKRKAIPGKNCFS
jgi:hypothetical protein